MNEQQIQKKLESMKGRSFEYAKQVHVVKSFIVDNINEKFELKTDKNTFRRKFDSAPDFFKYWYDQPENIVMDKALDSQKNAPADTMEVGFVAENNLADELVLILKDNIDKVQKSDKYIPQAQAINNSVNSILHVQKLKLDMLRTMRRNKS